MHYIGTVTFYFQWRTTVQMFTRRFLEDVRKKALRRGVWYTTLDNIERGIIFLTSRIVDQVRSSALGIEIVKILAKLKDALKSRFVRRMEEYGFRRVRILAAQAGEWGYNAAETWSSDLGFVRYVTLLDVYPPSGWGI